MTFYVVSERRRGRTGKSRWGSALLAAAVLSSMLAPGIGAAQNYSYSTGTTYGLPNAQTVKAKQADIDAVDAQAQELVDHLRESSPTAVEYAGRAYGALIFPDIQTESRLILGETNALGVLYVKDDAGKYQKKGYYQGRRNSLGLSGSGSSSRVFLFMTEQALDGFVAGEVTARYIVVNPETGETSGDADADIAAFVTNVKGDPESVLFKGLWIAPVTLIK
jgi:lipid-binding SYLF domain-containing protein